MLKASCATRRHCCITEHVDCAEKRLVTPSRLCTISAACKVLCLYPSAATWRRIDCAARTNGITARTYPKRDRLIEIIVRVPRFRNREQRLARPDRLFRCNRDFCRSSGIDGSKSRQSNRDRAPQSAFQNDHVNRLTSSEVSPANFFPQIPFR